MLKITTLSDNYKSENHNLHVEHGLSILLEDENGKFIFDFGASDKAVNNAKEMNIDLSDIDTAICSHAHYDHANGFPSFVEEANIKQLITGPYFFQAKYGYNGVKYTYLGINFTEEYLVDNKIEHRVCEDVLELSDNFYLVRNFKRTNAFEIIQPRFVKMTEEGRVQDSFDDEISIVYKIDKGLVVIVGCSHPGIINMLESISERFNQPIYAVLGGTHLVEADEERILLSIEKMKALGVKLLGLSHCSGDMAIQIASEDKDLIDCQLSVGDSIII